MKNMQQASWLKSPNICIQKILMYRSELSAIHNLMLRLFPNQNKFRQTGIFFLHVYRSHGLFCTGFHTTMRYSSRRVSFAEVSPVGLFHNDSRMEYLLLFFQERSGNVIIICWFKQVVIKLVDRWIAIRSESALPRWPLPRWPFAYTRLIYFIRNIVWQSRRDIRNFSNRFFSEASYG